MNALPPNLLYFIIYNPTLRPTRPIDDGDDEDAEEQAHVLFYTSNEHAVSRDRVLRQVGLAKAVVNFSSMFDEQSLCDSVHSLNRRMISVSPEPTYWIHACIELAKSQRIPKKLDKDKRKQAVPTYDYDESSIHDFAIRTQLLQGYERFKLSFGTFGSILSNEGKEALELQLERFFTVWAWSWDLSKCLPFTEYMGTRIHPLSSQLIPHVHSLTLPESYEWILLVANCAVIVKTQPPQYPSSLLSFFSSLLDRPTPRSRYDEEAEGPQQTSNENVDDGPNKTPQQGDKPGNTTLNSAATRFLGTPNFNMNVNVKWAWPNYLSFGARKASSAIPITSDATVETSTSKHSEITITEPSEPASHSTEIDSHTVAPTHDNDDEKSLASSHTRSASRISAIDSIALEDALTSDNITLASSADSRPSSPAPDTDFSTSPPDAQSDDSHGCADGEALARTIVLEPKCDNLRAIETEAGASSITSPIRPVALSEDMKASAGDIPIQVTIPPEPEPQTISSPPRVSFSFVRVYLPTITDSNEPTILKRRQVFYVKKDGTLFALVPLPTCVDELDPEDEETTGLAGNIDNMLSTIKETVDSEQGKISMALSNTPVQSVLQKSQHVITSLNSLILSSPSFSCTSWHLHEGRRTLSLDADTLEIYSRGQNPQDWHLVKRGEPVVGSHNVGDVYMEIGRKEASLTDVDYELSALVRRLTE